MGDLGEAFAKLCTDLFAGAILALEMGKARLDRGVFAFERIKCSIRHDRGVVLEVGAVCGRNLRCKLAQPGARRGLIQTRDILVCCCFAILDHAQPLHAAEIGFRGMRA